MILAPSAMSGGGLGVYSGRDVGSTEELFELCPSVAVAQKSVTGTTVQNYMFGLNDTHSTISLGLAMMYNHHSMPILENMWSRPSERRNQPLSDGLPHDVAFRPLRPIAKYEELFDSYGGDEWFRERNIARSEEVFPKNHVFPPDALPGCGGSDVDVRDWRAYATRSYEPGDIVEVIPGIYVLASNYGGTLLEPFLAPLDRKTSILLLGSGAIYFRAAKESTPEEASVLMSAWPDEENTATFVSTMYHTHPKNARRRSSGSDGLGSSTSNQADELYAFRAAKPIKPGDRLILDVANSPFYASGAEPESGPQSEL